jgi:hypothetical protein
LGLAITGPVTEVVNIGRTAGFRQPEAGRAFIPAIEGWGQRRFRAQLRRTRRLQTACGMLLPAVATVMCAVAPAAKAENEITRGAWNARGTSR